MTEIYQIAWDVHKKFIKLFSKKKVPFKLEGHKYNLERIRTFLLKDCAPVSEMFLPARYLPFRLYERAIRTGDPIETLNSLYIHLKNRIREDLTNYVEAYECAA